MYTKNILLKTDSYKASHWLQYRPGTEYISSYIESRGGKWDETLFFGLQIFLKEYLTTPITLEMIDEAAVFWDAHGEPFNRAGWEYILNEHDGMLPVRIEAVPEGTIVPTSNVLVQVVNTDPKCYWLTSFLETSLLRAVWYPTTVATNSYQCKKLIWEALKKSSDNPTGEIGFKLHDFGARGVSSAESAAIGGAAHLVNFLGSDTVEGVLCAREYYNENMAGFSIPAAEHSTMTSWGGEDGEVDAMRNMLKNFAKPGSLVAVVSDSYDIRRAVDSYWGEQLKEDVLNSGACIVIRPDSGDPETMPVEIISRLWEKFGGTMNGKGYRVLNPAVRVIQGDGINVDTIAVILKNLLEAGFSADNLAFGQGGGLLQQINRDTLNFAMKASAGKMVGSDDWFDIFKNPVDQPDKVSKKGRLALVSSSQTKDIGYHTIRETELSTHQNELMTVFENGRILVEWDFSDIRERAEADFH